jgi:hypothetical protein
MHAENLQHVRGAQGNKWMSRVEPKGPLRQGVGCAGVAARHEASESLAAGWGSPRYFRLIILRRSKGGFRF